MFQVTFALLLILSVHAYPRVSVGGAELAPAQPGAAEAIQVYLLWRHAVTGTSPAVQDCASRFGRSISAETWERLRRRGHVRDVVLDETCSESRFRSLPLPRIQLRSASIVGDTARIRSRAQGSDIERLWTEDASLWLFTGDWVMDALRLSEWTTEHVPVRDREKS